MDWLSTWAGAVEFLKSTGFAGIAAVAAALLTYRTSRQKTEWDAWWSRAEWALNQAISDDPTISQVGLAAALALVNEPTGTADRRSWLAQATSALLPPVGPEEQE